MSSGPVAVIDIGSNSIKILVAARGADGIVQPLKIRTLDARISAGIGGTQPRLSKDGMARGLDAIRTLLGDAQPFEPAKTILVATSAVRDADNGGEFRQRVRVATGHEIRILSGDEEADLIGRGLTCDPALHHLRDFYVFDLGGGSLECLAFRNRKIAQIASLPLGCVRLTEKFVADPAQPLSPADEQSIVAHTRDIVHRSGFRFDLPADAVAVGSGGSVSTARAMLGMGDGRSFEETDPVVTVAQLKELQRRTASLPLSERRTIPGLPPPRADVFPVALATLIAVAEAGDLGAFHNTVYNLRYGLAAEWLGGK